VSDYFIAHHPTHRKPPNQSPIYNKLYKIKRLYLDSWFLFRIHCFDFLVIVSFVVYFGWLWSVGLIGPAAEIPGFNPLQTFATVMAINSVRLAH
jgi:hypothetical protein